MDFYTPTTYILYCHMRFMDAGIQTFILNESFVIILRCSGPVVIDKIAYYWLITGSSRRVMET